MAGTELSLIDIVMMGLIAGSACYLLWRTHLKKKGACSGCDVDSCGVRKS